MVNFIYVMQILKPFKRSKTSYQGTAKLTHKNSVSIAYKLNCLPQPQTIDIVNKKFHFNHCYNWVVINYHPPFLHNRRKIETLSTASVDDIFFHIITFPGFFNIPFDAT